MSGLPASSSARALILDARRWYVELRICRVARGSLQWASYPALTCTPHARQLDSSAFCYSVPHTQSQSWEVTALAWHC